MTEQKVTSFELSQRLSELNFQSNSHCGWWDIKVNIGCYIAPNGDIYKDNKLIGWRSSFFDRFDYEDKKIIKSYDCHDLLMWLNKRSHAYYSELSIHGDRHHRLFNCPGCSDTNRSDQPQNALALAIIKILEKDSSLQAGDSLS